MIKQTAGRDQLSNISKEFAHLNDDILFGEVRNQSEISVKEKCVITIVALISKGILDNSLKYHIMNGKNHGISLSEISAIITHVAFYVGWPNAWATFSIVKEIYADEILKSNENGNHGGPFGMGEFNENYKQYFIGKSYLKVLSNSGLAVCNVTFKPRCRNNWHIHKSSKGGGQILICVEGEGLYQERGKEVQHLKVGDVVTIPANVKHWHGATDNSWFSHIAIEIPGENTSNERCEPVDDE